MAENFHERLKSAGVDAVLVRADGRGHATNFWRMALADDTTFATITSFLKSHSR
jgi:hypothetical protein